MTRLHALAFLTLCLLVAASGCRPAPTAEPPPLTAASLPVDENAPQRMSMVTDQIEARGIADPYVLAAMRKVPRHLFVPQDLLPLAYDDRPLPIGFGQTISQPYIVALMTESLHLEPGDRVLEIGTGSGYQAAVLAELGMEVYTVEIIPELATRAATLLQELGYNRLKARQGDGYYGWQEHAPYDAIIVTAAPDHLPQPLAAQLVEGGRLVVPIGPAGSYQTLWLFQKQGGEMKASNLGSVSFVPFTGAAQQ